ncbi:hypothetical protein BKA93DRAFT_751480 [Sparassis latifolia]
MCYTRRHPGAHTLLSQHALQLGMGRLALPRLAASSCGMPIAQRLAASGDGSGKKDPCTSRSGLCCYHNGPRPVACLCWRSWFLVFSIILRNFEARLFIGCCHIIGAAHRLIETVPIDLRWENRERSHQAKVARSTSPKRYCGSDFPIGTFVASFLGVAPVLAPNATLRTNICQQFKDKRLSLSAFLIVLAFDYAFNYRLFAWPPNITGVERIVLSAHGDLQRLLSAFFSRSINVALIYSHTTVEDPSGVSTSYPPSLSALPHPSPTAPLVQQRQVHLLCGSSVVCVATSTVRVTAAAPAQLFFGQKYAIGQVFRKMGCIPEFELVEAGVDGLGGPGSLWRKYKLYTEGFACEILEVFPNRDMFVRGEAWLNDKLTASASPRFEFAREDITSEEVMVRN